jgi:hypothetical protein
VILLTTTYTKEFYFKKEGGEAKDPKLEGIKILIVVVSTWYEGTTPEGLPVADLTEAIKGYVVLLQNTYGEGSVTVLGAGYDADAGVFTPSGGVKLRKSVGGKRAYDYRERTILTLEEVLGLLGFEEGKKEAYDQIHFCGHGAPYDPETNISGGMTFETDTGYGGFPDRGTDWWKEDVPEEMESEKEGEARAWWPIKEEGKEVKGFVETVKIVLAGCFSCTGSMKGLFENAVGSGNVHCCKGVIKFGIPEYDAAGNIIMRDWYEYDETIQAIARFLGIPEAE